MSEQTEHGPRGIGLGMTIEEYTVGSWCPTPDGTGPAVAVAIELKVNGLPPLVMRLKSRRAVQEMIFALEKHRDDVFGAEKIVRN